MDLSPFEIVVVASLVALLLGLLVQAARIGRLRDEVARLRQGVGPVVPLGGAGLQPDVEAQVRGLVASGKKIVAIKLVRERTGLGLKDAKDLVERM